MWGRVALPVVETISPLDFSHAEAMVAKAGFDWRLSMDWLYFPWSYFDEPANYVRPFKSASSPTSRVRMGGRQRALRSPSMSGGLLAVRAAWFRESGEYDEGMEIWGGENVELALRVRLRSRLGRGEAGEGGCPDVDVRGRGVDEAVQPRRPRLPLLPPLRQRAHQRRHRHQVRPSLLRPA